MAKNNLIKEYRINLIPRVKTLNPMRYNMIIDSNKELQSAYKWLVANKMCINVSKGKYSIFSI